MNQLAQRARPIHLYSRALGHTSHTCYMWGYLALPDGDGGAQVWETRRHVRATAHLKAQNWSRAAGSMDTSALCLRTMSFRPVRMG